MIGTIDRAIVEMIKKADRMSLVIGDVRIQLDNDGKTIPRHSARVSERLRQ